MRLLTNHGASLDAGDHASRTPLMQAAERGSETIVKTLLRFGANHELRDADGVDALRLATKNNHPHVVYLQSSSKK